MSLLKELQRRSVFKVAAAYLVVAWLVIQVAATVSPQLALPDWAPRLITLLVLLGFPVALVLAWVFDVTPEGIKADPAPVGNKRVFATAAVLAAFALGWFYRGDIAQVGGGDGQKRLAVLPLANFSPDPANAFFADGLHDDLLTALSRMNGVEVVSRTTMQTFKDSKKKLSEIAGEVGATQVLEGSVRRDGTRVRLTVQLIDARSDDHLWAETYDRPLADALTLQNEVAQAVAKAMKVAIASGADDAPPTANPAAYDLYLKARLTLDYAAQLALLDSALLLDPGFTQARAMRAFIACYRVWFDETLSASLVPQVEADIARVRAERPDLLELGIAEAQHLYYIKRDWPAALTKIEAVLARDSNDAAAHRVHGFLLRRLGRVGDATAAMQRNVALDPGNPIAQSSYIDMLQFAGRVRDAIGVLDAFIAKRSVDGANLATFQGFRSFLVYRLTGDRARFQADIEVARSVATDQAAWLAQRYLAQDPSAERIAYYKTRTAAFQPSEDGALYPSALDIALDADYLGDAAERDRALGEAAKAYATVPPAVLARPFSMAFHAWFLALRGERAAALAEAERALAAATPKLDATATAGVSEIIAPLFAREGETERALDLVEATLANPSSFKEGLLHDPVLRKHLASVPRYQALMKQIEARFEKL